MWLFLKKHVHWIGLRENLQETVVFTIKYDGLSCKCSHHPILWCWCLSVVTNINCLVYIIVHIQLETHGGWGYHVYIYIHVSIEKTLTNQQGGVTTFTSWGIGHPTHHTMGTVTKRFDWHKHGQTKTDGDTTKRTRTHHTYGFTMFYQITWTNYRHQHSLPFPETIGRSWNDGFVGSSSRQDTPSGIIISTPNNSTPALAEDQKDIL